MESRRPIMKVLYISKLDGRPWIGPSYSVPRQIEAQTKYDDVFWYNLYDAGMPEGEKNVEEWRKLDYYHDLLSFPKGQIKELPHPFSNPDIIIIEQLYPFARIGILREISKIGIPYIIVPRGELTRTAQSKKKVKKIIGNAVLGLNTISKKASAIQCLTEQEKEDTSDRWNRVRIVIPNGTVIPSNERVYDVQHSSLRIVSIGRLEPYQKGLDILIDACSQVKELLIKNNVRIDIYGSDIENKKQILIRMIEELKLNDVVKIHEPVFGNEKENVLINSDVFVMPSRFEGHPTGLLEALSYGIPCVVTSGSNMKREIEDADAGWTAENDSESLKVALINVIAEKDEIKTKGHNARRLAFNYDWNAIAYKTHLEYNELISH